MFFSAGLYSEWPAVGHLIHCETSIFVRPEFVETTMVVMSHVTGRSGPEFALSLHRHAGKSSKLGEFTSNSGRCASLGGSFLG